MEHTGVFPSPLLLVLWHLWIGCGLAFFLTRGSKVIFHKSYSFQTDRTFLSSPLCLPQALYTRNRPGNVFHIFLGTAVLCHSCFQHHTHEVLRLLLQARMRHTRMGHIRMGPTRPGNQSSKAQWDLEGNALKKGCLKWHCPLILCSWSVCLKQESQCLNFYIHYCQGLKSVHPG